MKMIETERLFLKSILKSEVNLLVDYYLRNLDFLKPRIPVSDITFYNSKNLLDRIVREKDLYEKKTQLSFYIFKRENPNNIIGNVTVSNIIGGCFQSGYLGYQLDKIETGKGYGTEAVRNATQFAFSEFDLHRIEANVMTDNLPSISLLERSGFIKEGFSKKYLKINGKWEDHFRYAVLSDQE